MARYSLCLKGKASGVLCDQLCLNPEGKPVMYISTASISSTCNVCKAISGPMV